MFLNLNNDQKLSSSRMKAQISKFFEDLNRIKTNQNKWKSMMFLIVLYQMTQRIVYTFNGLCTNSKLFISLWKTSVNQFTKTNFRKVLYDNFIIFLKIFRILQNISIGFSHSWLCWSFCYGHCTVGQNISALANM